MKSSIINFINVFQQSPENHGGVKFLPSPYKIETDIPLNEDLKSYFECMQFKEKLHIGGYFNLFLFPSQDLSTAQSGWRWITSKSGKITEDIINWNANWVVIADKDGDVIFVDTDSGKIFGSIQKRNFFIADNISFFLDALTEAMKVEMEKYNFEVLTEDIDPKPEFIEDVKNSIFKTLGESGAEGFMKFFFY